MTPEQIAQDIAALKALKTSRGWAIVEAAMVSETMAAAFAMADNPNMPEAEMHFRRGAIFAARSHASILDTLIVMRENEALMASAGVGTRVDAADPDATA